MNCKVSEYFGICIALCLLTESNLYVKINIGSLLPKLIFSNSSSTVHHYKIYITL